MTKNNACVWKKQSAHEILSLAQGHQSKPALWRGSWYYLVPALISILQLVYILASNTNIREEELAESVRNIFWLDHRLLYDGTSSNVGYYGLLLVAYKIWGFSIRTAKYVRLILYVAAMYSLAVLLRKFLKQNHAALALVTSGLSSTILFFNTIQTSYGMDILYGMICLLIILSQGGPVFPASMPRSMLPWLVSGGGTLSPKLLYGVMIGTSYKT